MLITSESRCLTRDFDSIVPPADHVIGPSPQALGPRRTRLARAVQGMRTPRVRCIAGCRSGRSALICRWAVVRLDPSDGLPCRCVPLSAAVGPMSTCAVPAPFGAG